MKRKEIKLFKDIQAPNREKSFKERTGKEFDGKVRHKIIDLGNGYGKTEKDKMVGPVDITVIPRDKTSKTTFIKIDGKLLFTAIDRETAEILKDLLVNASGVFTFDEHSATCSGYPNPETCSACHCRVELKKALNKL